jgi:uncharacterized protein involved in outer membrane biogenesis
LFSLPLLVVALGAWGEYQGWPWLQQPLQRFLSQALQREVSFAPPEGAIPEGVFRVQLLDGIHLRLPYLRVAAPAWSSAPHLLQASEVALALDYADLWRAHQGQPVHLRLLRAVGMDARLEQLPDGRASWQFGDPAAPGGIAAPSVGQLQIVQGTLHYHNQRRDIELLARLSLTEGAGAAPADTDTPGPPPAETMAHNLLQVRADGHYHDQPLQVALTSTGALPWVAGDVDAAAGMAPAPLSVSASVGRARLSFEGRAQDLRHLLGLTGRFTVSGPSLAAVGDPVGVTLPSTAAFRVMGRVVKQGSIWNVVADEATVGSSRVNGAFRYDTAREVPLLAGRLGGSRLLLADLAPAVGGAPYAAASAPVVSAAGAAKDNLAQGPPPKQVKAPGKLLPARPFDLGALRAMDADVLVDVAELDLNTPLLQSLRPLRTHVRLSGGVLTLGALDARTAQGRLTGDVQLDGRGDQALWHANLNISGVRLEQWLRIQRQPADAPPYITGELDARAEVDGKGRSTADLLASLDGRVHGELRGGTLSRLLMEFAELDVIPALGALLNGDGVMPVNCGVTDLVAQQGVLRPRVMVVDTPSSTVWVDGTLSLAQETLDLRAVVSPKDFSPVSLRTPLQVQGSFANPQVSVQKGPLGRKLGGALLLGLVNPLASLLAFVDPGDEQSANHDSQGCRALQQRGTAWAKR